MSAEGVERGQDGEPADPSSGSAPRPRSKARLASARLVHTALRGLGFDLVRLKHVDDFAARRQLALARADVVLDVGANVGMYARLLRQGGFGGRIVSVEPLPGAYEKLRRASEDDPLWQCLPLGLAAESGFATLHVSRNLASSSLLVLTPRETREAPETAVVDAVEVRVASLDSLRGTWFDPTERLFLKLDVQGAEAQVLEGAELTLAQVVAIESELSIAPLYEGGELISQLVRRLSERGFRLVAVESAYRDLRSGELKQLNGLFLPAA